MKRKSEILQKEKSFDDNITTLQNKKNIIIKQITLLSSGWKIVNYEGVMVNKYEYRDNDISYKDVVNINISPKNILQGDASTLLPLTASYDGYIDVLADKDKTPPNLYATMIIQKEVI